MLKQTQEGGGEGVGMGERKQKNLLTPVSVCAGYTQYESITLISLFFSSKSFCKLLHIYLLIQYTTNVRVSIHSQLVIQTLLHLISVDGKPDSCLPQNIHVGLILRHFHSNPEPATILHSYS